MSIDLTIYGLKGNSKVTETVVTGDLPVTTNGPFFRVSSMQPFLVHISVHNQPLLLLPIDSNKSKWFTCYHYLSRAEEILSILN